MPCGSPDGDQWPVSLNWVYHDDRNKENAMTSFNPHRMRPPRERVLAVEAGQVVCPRRGIVDLEMCWDCPAYRGLTTGPREGVICGTEPVFLSIAARWPVGHLAADELADH
jgi:hypothetical protein